MLKLKESLQAIGRTQADLARELSVSPALVAQIINHGQWPKSGELIDLPDRIRNYLCDAGANDAQIDQAFDLVGDKKGSQRANAGHPDPEKPSERINQEDVMLMRKQVLTPAAKKAFQLFMDPFADEAIQSAADMYLSPDIRYVRESLFSTAKFGGVLAVVAESGAGKTTLLRDMEDRVSGDGVVVIKPYVLAMEDNDQRGKTLKSTHIAESIMAAVAPLQRPASSPEARFRQLHTVLKGSAAAGSRHCLVIDEAHALPLPTINHLKRFYDLEVGFKKLISIVLIGQPELKQKLSERNASVREFVQRCEMVELSPLEGSHLDKFLQFKFDRQGKDVANVIDQGGIDAMRSRLTLPAARKDGETRSLLYPLAVGNLMNASMNLAAGLGVPIVTADVVKGV